MKERSELKSYVKECAQQSRATTAKRLQLKASGEDRQSIEYQRSMWDLHGERRDRRYNGRLAHLAYGFCLGVPYLAMEAKAESAPSAGVIAFIARAEEDLVLAWLAGETREAAA
jgi:hypothetical protein